MSPSKGVLVLFFVFVLYSSHSDSTDVTPSKSAKPPSCSGSSSNTTITTTVTTTETRSVYNSSTGLWVNVTTTGNSTIIGPGGSNSTGCSKPPKAPCNGTSSTTVLITETKSVYNSTTGLWVNVTTTRNQTVTRPPGSNSTSCDDKVPPPDTGNKTLCNGTSATTTVTVTETKPMYNANTGLWENVTTTRNYTVTRPPGSNATSCESVDEGWRAYVYFKSNMMKYTFKEWMDYFKSVSKNEWDFEAFEDDLGDNITDIECSAASQTRLQISSIMNVFRVFKDIQKAEEREESCRWLKASLRLNLRHRHSCMDDHSDDGMDSSDSGVMARRLRATHTAEMNGFGEVLCALPFRGNKTVWTDAQSNMTCNLWAIRNTILASLHIKLGWDEDSSCKEATMALSYLQNYLQPCNSRLRFLLATLIRQAEMRQRMVCTPPTCNIPYASTCALDAEMRMKKFLENSGPMNVSMGQGANQTQNMPSQNTTGGPMKDEIEKFCRGMQITFACVANHTISCDSDTYGSLNMRVQLVSKQFRRICGDVITLPPEKCKPPPAMPLEADRPDRNNTSSGHSGMINMTSPSTAVLIRRMAQYSLFNDTFLCQVTLRTDAKYDMELVKEVCGLKGVDDELRCLSNTMKNGISTDPNIVKCNASRGDESRCMLRGDRKTATGTARCAAKSECSLPIKQTETLECCDDNLCNHVTYNASSSSCPCKSLDASEMIRKALTGPTMNESMCTSLRENLQDAMQGCSDYSRHSLTVSPTFNGIQRRCRKLRATDILYAARCGNACLEGYDWTQVCELLGFPPCGTSYADCLAAKSAGCSGRQIVRIQSLRILSFQAGGTCSRGNETSEILQSGQSSSDPFVNAVFRVATPLYSCISQWIITPDPKATWPDIILGLRKCLADTNITQLPNNVVSRRIIHLVSSLSNAVLKMRNETTFNPACLVINGRAIFQYHLLAANIPPLSSNVCRNQFIGQLSLLNCSDEVKQIVQSAFIPDCVETYAQNCQFQEIKNCFFGFTTSAVKNVDELMDCLKNTTGSCEAYEREAIIQVAREIVEATEYKEKDNVTNQKEDKREPVPLPYDKDSVQKYYGNSTCVCDPALAVHCIFEVHHLSKQDDPDWENLCPLVNKSSMCAHRYVQGCDEPKQKTVKEIVSKLNYGLRKTCEDPPESECKSIKAMDCVMDLMKYQKANRKADNITTCIEISKTRKCIEKSLKGCERTTELKVNSLLNEVIERWDDLDCEDPDALLGTCRDLFEENVKHILSVDMNAMFSNLENNITKQWDDFQEVCEDMDDAWECVSSTLENIKRRGSKIIMDSLKGIYLSMKKMCMRRATPLKCYSCFGQGPKSCASGETAEQCNAGSVCQTVNDQGTVMSRGCTPRPSCMPGCIDNKCTYCCSDSLCNDLDNGPITGSCDRQAMSQCIFDLSLEFTEKDSFSCSSVELALDCLRHERMQCQMGGVSFSLEEVSSASLRAQVQVCQLQEANQVCTIQPVTATASFVSACGMHIDKKSLCSIVADNRKALMLAKNNCTEDEIEDIKRNVMAFEDTLGYLDCSDPYGFILGKDCRVAEAMECLEYLTMNMNETLSCDEISKGAGCIDKHLKECKPDLYLWPIRQRFEDILKNSVSGSCDAQISDNDMKDKAVTEIEKCLDGFVRALGKSNPLDSILNAAEGLQACLFDLDPELILKLTSVQGLYLETVATIIETITENNVTSMAGGPSSLTSMCSKGLDKLVRHHALNALILPLTVTKRVPSVCKSLEETVEMVTEESCAMEIKDDNAFIAFVFGLLDMMRDKLFVGFCPDVQPIPRCLVDRAEQCLEQFSAYVGFGHENSSVLCDEARALVSCAKSFASTCSDGETLKKLRSKSYFAVDTITQVCSEDPDLVGAARCSLLRQFKLDAKPGCNLSLPAQCDAVTDNSTCLEVEKTIPCFLEGVGGCLDTYRSVASTPYKRFKNQVATCRSPTWPDGTPRDDASLFRACNDPPSKCNVPRAANCLSTLAKSMGQGGANITEGVAVAKACLEENFYCFSSVITLLSSNITEYSQLLVNLLQLTPEWSQMESGLIIRLLNLPTFVLGALEQTPAVSLNLWDICWNMDSALSQLQAVGKDFPNMDLQSFKESTEDLKFSIQNMCNNFGAVAEMLQFPQQENPTCAAAAITTNIDILMSRSMAEFYRNEQVGAPSVCSFFMVLNESMSASLQASPLSLDDCSEGFRAQVSFKMHVIHLMIRNRCEMVKSGGSPRCSIKEVGKCVRRLYNKGMLLGITQTAPDICNELMQAEDCVRRFSFKCDDSRMGRVRFMWRSVQRAAERTCEQQRHVSVCDDGMDPEHAECDVHKAKKCSLKQLRNVIDPFARHNKKCRHLGKNIECIKAYTKNCTDIKLPKLFMLDPDDVEDVQELLKCDKDADDETFGCRKGCMIDSAQECLATFQSSMSRNMWGVLTSETCSSINDMRFCVATHTKTCRLNEKRVVIRAQDKLLERFPQHHEACVDVAKCTGDFDSLVRQIKDLKAIDAPGYGDDLYGDDDACDDEMKNGNDAGQVCDKDMSSGKSDMGRDGYNDGKDMKSTGPSLEALCNRIRQIWTTCLQPGMKLLPQEKSTTAMSMYNSIWAVVEEQCSDTTQVSCYMCKNETDPNACEKDIQRCPFNQKVCLLHQSSEGKEIRYSASCANPRSCYNDANDNTQVSCCDGYLCNTPTEVSKSAIDLEPETCKFENALMCALDFTMMYISTDEIKCRRSTQRLTCVQRYGQTCTSKASKSLIEATNGVFLELASSSCLVEPTLDDCFSLAIFSMQAILSNSYASEGNLPCVALQETEDSVKQTIANGNCSDTGRVSLESSLAFIRSIVGPYCEPGECDAVNWADIISGDGVCSRQIFRGIKSIYYGYNELAKSKPDCRLLSSYVEEAQSLLGNCKLVAFLEGKLKALDSNVQQRCGQIITSSLPPVCVGTCQTDVVLTFVRQLRSDFDAASDQNATCITLMQLERVYFAYTKDCTSVQQRDVVRNIMLKLASEIEYCEQSDSSFEFDLELKRDIYYRAIECQLDFQSEVAKAFESGNQEILCNAVKDVENCEYELPSVFEELIMGSTKDLLSFIETAGLCDGSSVSQNGTVTRKKRATCDISLLSNLIQLLLIPPNVALASFESRDIYCQETKASFEQAKSIESACAGSLNLFQQKLFDIMKMTVEKNNEKLCPPLRFEEETCKPEMVSSCFDDFFNILGFANIPTDSVCRQARFSLECMSRFTDSCGSAENGTAMEVIHVAVRMVKHIVTNKCPGLVEYLFCRGDLSTISEGCQLEKANQCAAEAKPELSQRFTEGYCESKQEKVDCTKKNLIGCEDKQIKNVTLPSQQLDSICGIKNTTLDGICRSHSHCSMNDVEACFSGHDKCENQGTIFSCDTDLNKQQPLCKETIFSAITKIYFLQFYSADHDRCNFTIIFNGNNFVTSMCVKKISYEIFSQLSNATSSADQILHQSIKTVSECINGSSVRRMIDVGALQKWLISINDTLNTENMRNNLPSGLDPPADSGNCSYSKVSACISLRINLLLYMKFLNTVERNKFCKSYSENSIAECFKENLESCSEDKKTWYASVNARVNKVIDDLGVCEPPQTCIVSEAYACINKFGAMISQFDRTQDKIALCTGRIETKSCIESFTYTCSNSKANEVMRSYNELVTKVNIESLCKGVELPPPPICPELPESNRVCYMGSAFTCLFKFSINILQGDSLIWRQQCMTIQKMMTCVARSTSGCKETDEDVKSIRRLLKEFVAKAGDHCPWLTENLCTEQAPCPVTTAGCEVDLEQGLINRRTDVCTLERIATECVKNNTLRCTKAQRNQALNVMKKKLEAADLPGDLMCDGGNIEGHLYSFLMASADVTVSSRNTSACANYDKLYNNLNTQYSNPDSKEDVTLAKSLIDVLYTERVRECKGGVSDKCAIHFPVKSFGTLITDLMVKDLHLTSFCAQAQALLIMNETYSDCSSKLFNLLQTPYMNKCMDKTISCGEAEKNLADCISGFGDISTLSCSGQQKAAGCVSTHLPSHCAYNEQWLNATNLCSDVVVLQAMHTGRSKQFICEAGLVGYFGWKRVAGSGNFTITIDTVAKDADSVPRCLKGPKENDPIPQVFYTGPRSKQPMSNLVEFNVYGREDYKKDGPQVVQVGFTLSIGSESYNLPVTMVYVNDRNIPNSVCSSINDPHIRTHDDIKYNNMDVGRFILWRHTMLAEAVVVQYSQCAKYGSCNCGVKVYAGTSSVTFDLCDQNTDLVSYYAEAGADAFNQQWMAVMMGTDLNTYSVVLLSSGTIVKVRIEGKFMNVWVTPSGRDVGATQGLCGVYDGDGYNDFQLPDFSQYEMKKVDGDSGDLVPNDFNKQWKITKAQADDYNQVFVPNVTISTNPVPINCYTWIPRAGETSVTKCGKWANLAFCGLVNGDDQVAALLANFKQSSNSGQRRKRQATDQNDEDGVSLTVENARWPTQSGWTLESATAWCLDNIPDDTLQKCIQAVDSLNGTLELFQLDEQVKDCVGDIKASDGTDWLEGARISAYEHCIAELNENPSYQNNAESSNLAIQFLDSTCTPPDCSGHGSCSKGSCNCYDGYYGTRCDISREDLSPPVLKEPEDGVHMCEIDSNSDCSSVFISGSNFVSSSRLSCHFEEVAVTEVGQREIPGSQKQIVQAQLIARDRVRCDLGERSTWKRSLRISVSNDGITPHSQYQLFVAYDPVCFNCDPSTCIKQTGVCVIGNTCVMPGVSSIYDECEYCDLKNPTQWTIRKNLDYCKDRPEDNSDESNNSESNNSDTLLVPLVGAGCALLALLIIAVIGLIVFLKRRDNRKRNERQERNGQGNLGYVTEQPPFDGSPVLRVNTREDQSGKNLSPDHYQVDA
ncbi:hypothetical protein RRG08_004071 [Elysia crispata]|uniref:VWFD domain-containing protein n=1 Tax=Elysia crispata TaxID=231223 RepID=A0AAE1D2V4_9GAST|nr:hypothetical protein RRG08_004071 [Elysia crispata]